VTRFEDTLRERLVIEPDPRSATQFTPFMEGITVAERDAIVDALKARRYLAALYAHRPGLAALARLDGGVSE
jgi:hypothetical protein